MGGHPKFSKSTNLLIGCLIFLKGILKKKKKSILIILLCTILK